MDPFSLLYEVADKLAVSVDGGDTWDIFVDACHRLLGRGVVIASEFDDDANRAVLRAVRGIGPTARTLLETTLGPLTGLDLTVPDAGRHLPGARLAPYEGDLSTLVPRAVLDPVLRLLGVGVVLAVGLWGRPGHRLGALNLILPPGDPLPERPVVEALARYAGLALRAQHDVERLAAREAQLRALLDAAPVGIATSSHRTLLQVNGRLCEMVGLGPDDLVGQSTRVLYATDADYARAGEACEQLPQGQPRRVSDSQWRHRDGTTLDVHLTAAPLDPADTHTVVFTALDTTQAHRDARHLYRLVNALSELGGEADANRDRLVHEAADILGARGACLRRHAEVPCRCAFRVGERPCQRISEAELLATEPAGGAGWATHPVTVSGRVTGTLAVLLDPGRDLDTSERRLLGTLAVALGREEEREAVTTERLRLETRVLQAQRMEGLGVLAGGIAHDFNNLLTGIAGNAELAAASLPPGHPARRLMADARVATQRSHELVQQLLAYAGRASLERRPVDLAAAIPEAVHNLSAALSKKVSVHTDVHPGWARLDPVQLHQVLLNLLTNASEALEPAGGDIRVSSGVVELQVGEPGWQPAVTAAGRYTWFRVHDDGGGVEPGTHDQLFDPFFSTKGVGRGLGLASVMGIVRSHGGTLHLESSPSEGTSVTVALPAIPLPSGAPEPTAPSQLTGTVLLADDEPLVRRVGERMLSRLGFTVVAVADGQQAVDALTAAPDRYAAAVLDLAMPRLDGAEALVEMRRTVPDLPAIIVSGWAPEEITPRLPPDVRILQKPYSYQVLAVALSGIISAR